jgi:hypothetical protein
MIILSQATDTLQVLLAGAVDTNQLSCMASWRDRTSNSFIAGRTVAVTNDTTPVNIISSPAASTQRVIDFISIYNADVVQTLVTVRFNDNGITYILWKGYLDPDQTVNYVEGSGWTVMGGYRSLKVFTVHGDAGANFPMTNATQAERFAGNATRHLFLVDLEGYSQVRLRSNKQVGSASVNTPLFRARYYTSYNTTVGNFLQLGNSSQVEFSVTATGYADTGWIDLAAGAKILGCCIGFTELGGDGVADPALGATDILFR